MTYIGLALMGCSFAVGLAAHILVWRIRRPKDDALILFLLVALAPWCLSALGARWLAWEIPLGWASYMVLAGVFHGATGFTYMSLYTAAQAASPSALILLRAAQAGAAGMTESELAAAFTTTQLCGDSVQAAIEEKFILDAEGVLRVAPRGRAILRICGAVRRVLSLPPGRG